MNGKECMEIERIFCEIVEKGEKEYFASRSREGIFSAALVMWAEIISRLKGRKSLTESLEALYEGEADGVILRNKRSEITIEEVSMNTGGLCRARQRLGIDKVEKLCRLISEHLLKENREEIKWNGKRAYLMDGTVITLARSDKTFAKYAPVRNQNGGGRTGQMVCTCLHDLFTGIALSPAYGAYKGENAVGETTLGKSMLQRLGEPGIVIADRGFGMFSIGWTARQMGHDILLRLTKTRRDSIRKVGIKDIDENVNWRVGSVANHPEIPVDAEISGRLIQRTVTRKGFRPLTLAFFTTLEEPIEELLTLYLQRERIENDIRSVKQTLEMEMLFGKTPEVIEKELLLGFAAYNLVRGVLARAAHELKIPARKISFSAGLRFIRSTGNMLRDAKSASKKDKIMERFKRALYQTKLPNRSKQRIEPRKVIRHPAHFPVMKKSRDEERTEALKVAKKHGHRGYYTTASRKY